MSIFDHHRFSAIRTGIIVILAAHFVVLPPTLPMARARAAPLVPSFDDLMVQAEQKRSADAHAESAMLYGQAYRARPEATRADDIGEITPALQMAA